MCQHHSLAGAYIHKGGFVIASPIWKCYEKLVTVGKTKKAKCLSCQALIVLHGGATFNLWHHLRSAKHWKEYCAAKDELSYNLVIWDYFLKRGKKAPVVDCVNCAFTMLFEFKSKQPTAREISVLWRHLKDFHQEEFQKATKQREVLEDIKCSPKVGYDLYNVIGSYTSYIGKLSAQNCFFARLRFKQRCSKKFRLIKLNFTVGLVTRAEGARE